MCKKLIYLVSFVLVLLVGSAGATTITNVGSEIDFTAWRTAAGILDADGDGMYGTDGYVMFGAAGENQTPPNGANGDLQSDPAYAMIVNNAPGQSGVSGSVQFLYALIDNVSGTAPGTMVSGTTTDGATDEPLIATITIGGGVPSVFRLGLMHDNLDGTAFVSPSYDIKNKATGTALATVVNETTLNQQPDWFFVDIAGAKPGDVFEIHGAVSANGYRTLGGITFDTSTTFNPSPANEATDVPPDAVLSWTPGEYVEGLSPKHKVLFSENFDDVNDGAAVVATQDANTYDPPGLLDFGTTYYWRIDEANSTTAWDQGEVWSFTTEPYSIPIDAVTATASNAQGAMLPENTVNGSGLNELDQHTTKATDMWLSAAGGQDIWIQYAFAKPQKLHQMWVWNSNQSIESIIGFGAKNVTIETSMDGTTWTALADVPEFAQASGFPDYTHNTVVDFGGVSAQYVKLAINAGWGTLTKQYGLSEVRFFAIPVYARQPQPAAGASDLAPEVVLSWRAGRDAAAHEVYLGTDPNALTLAGQTSETRYTVSVALDQTHYWRIDEVNEVEDPATWEGDVWSFSSTLYIVIDDMESYKSEDGKWIWETWTDGFENPSNGALLGHSGDNMETEIVYEGSQSLPYNYGQNGAAVSEATLPIDAQDWSKNEVRSLSLMFYGDPDNTPGQMYVGINGSRIVDYPGTPDDMKQSLWHAWQIDLQSLGITTVNSLTLGIQGGTGTIYVDAIRLYPKAPAFVTPVEPAAANLVAYYALDGAATDASGNGAHGVENSFPTYEAGVEGQAIRLDGIDDFVDLGIPEHWPSGAAPRTLCAWAQTFSVEPGWRVIAGYGSPAGGQGTGLVMNGTSLYGSGYGSDVSIDNFWAVEEWHHVGLTYDGTTVRLYADGVEVVSGEVDWNTVITVARIGRQVNEAQEFWDGRVDEVRLYDQALSMAEMAWLAGRTVPVAKPF